MSNPVLEKLAREVAARLNDNWTETNKEQTQSQRGEELVTTDSVTSESSISLSANDQLILTTEQNKYISEHPELSRSDAITAFSNEFNALINEALTKEGTTVSVDFAIPDLNKDTPGFDNDARDTTIDSIYQTRESMTAYEVLELDKNNRTNLTQRTADDVYRENKSFYDTNTIDGVKINSGSDIRNLLNSRGENLDSSFRETLTNQIDNHFLNQESSVHVVSASNRGIAGNGLRGASMEYRSRTMKDLAKFLSEHENGAEVLEGIFKNAPIVAEISSGEKATTSTNDRRDILTQTGELTAEQQQIRLTEIERSVVDMSNYFGPSGTDLLLTGMLNNPELAEQPFMEAWKQLNPSTQGENGRIARAYLKEETVFERITEDFENQDKNATLGELVRHTIARDIPETPEVPDVKIKATAVTETVDKPEIEIIEKPEEKEPVEVGLYSKGYQLPFDQDSAINVHGIGATVKIPTEKGSLEIDAGILKGGLSSSGQFNALKPFEHVVPEGFEAFRAGDNALILADPNDPDSAGLGNSDPSLVRQNENGADVVDVGGANANITQDADFMGADVNVRFNNDEKKYSMGLGGTYGKDIRRASFNFQTDVGKQGVKVGGGAEFHSIKTNTAINVEENPINIVSILYEGIPAGVDENGKPIFDPEIQTEIDQNENIELIPRTIEVDKVPDKDPFIKEAGIILKEGVVNAKQELIKPLGIKPKDVFVETQIEKFKALGVVPVEQWVQPLQHESLFPALDATLPAREWICPPGANAFSWYDIEGERISISEAVAANQNNEPGRPNPYSDAELSDPNLWQWEVVDGQPFSPDDADSYILPDGTGPVEVPFDVINGLTPITSVSPVGPRVPISELPDGTFVDQNDTEDWRTIEGAELITLADAQAAGIPDDQIVWQEIEGEYFTAEQVAEYGIPPELQESVFIDTGEFILLSEAQANNIPFVEGSEVWQDVDGDLIESLADAQALGIPDSEIEWVSNPSGEPVTPEEAEALGYPEELQESIFVIDPDAEPILLVDAINNNIPYDPESLVWQAVDPAEYITLDEAQAAAANGLPNMPESEFEWALIPDGNLLTPEEADALNIPDEIRTTVWIENGELITVEEANEQGVPYDDSEIITETQPELDSEGLQLYDVVRTSEERVNTRTFEHHDTSIYDMSVNKMQADSWTKVSHAHLYALIPLGKNKNTVLGVDVAGTHTDRPEIEIGGDVTKTNEVINEQSVNETIVTDDIAIASNDPNYADNPDIATGVIEGQTTVNNSFTSDNSFTQNTSEYETFQTGTATKLSAGVSLNHTFLSENLTLGGRAEFGTLNNRDINSQYLGGELRSRTVTETNDGYFALGANASKTFANGFRLSAAFQRSVGGPEGVSGNSYSVRGTIPIGSGKTKEQKKLEKMKAEDAKFDAENAQKKTKTEKLKEMRDSKPNGKDDVTTKTSSDLKATPIVEGTKL